MTSTLAIIGLLTGVNGLAGANDPWAIAEANAVQTQRAINMPADYPRINQWPEWFTAQHDARYEVRREGQAPQVVEGSALLDWPAAAEPHQPLRLTVRPLAARQPASPPTQPAPS